MNKPVRWGILGPGKIAEKFAEAINYVEGAELYAVASRQKEKAAAFAHKWKAMHYYGSYEELVMDATIDIIYIATPHSFHCEQAILCLRNGKPVLCEKPMALSYEQSSKMIDTARIQDVFLMEGMWSRFMQAINKTKELIESGIIGSVQYIDVDFGFSTPFDANSRLYDKRLGGGSILDVGIYPVFLTTFLLGEPTAIHSVSKLAPTGADEYCNAIFHYEEGKTAHIFSGINIETDKSATIYGTLGKIFIPTPWYRSAELKVSLTNGESSYYSFPHGCNGFEYEIQEVMDCLKEGFRECPAMPLDFSLQLSKITSTLCKQAGVVY